MADVMDAWFRGLAARQAQDQHDQATQENSLRAMVLRHQLSSLKLQDALNANDLKRTYANLGVDQGVDQGQTPASGASPGAGVGASMMSPTASAPGPSAAPADGSSDVGGPPWASGYRPPAGPIVPDAPPASLADHLQAVIGQRLGTDPSAASPSAPAPVPAPPPVRYVTPINPSSGLPPVNLHTSEPTPPGYQDTHPAAAAAIGRADLGTADHPAMTAASDRVWLDPIQIPELGVNVPGQWYSAKAARDQEQARAIAVKRAEQPLVKYGPGEKVFDPFLGKDIAQNTNPKPGETAQEQYINEVLANGPNTSKAKTLLQGINDMRAPTGAETKSLLVDGTPMEVIYDSRTRKFTNASNGSDLTGHQIRPMPPASVQVQNRIETDARNAPVADATRPDPATANVVSPKTGLTPNAEYQAAMTYALEGKMPSQGFGNSPRAAAARSAVQAKAGALAAAAGVDLPQLQAEYRANSGALTKLLPQAKATATFANTATDNLDLALAQSDQVARSGSKLANRYLQWIQGELTPAKGLTQFETYIYTAAREYAKVTNGAAMSAAGLSDSATREAGHLLNATQSPEAFAAAATAMKNDMANVLGEQSKTLAGVSETLGNFFSAVNGGGPVQGRSAPTAPGAGDAAGGPTTGGTMRKFGALYRFDGTHWIKQGKP
jgi:hypothetical protein